MLGGELCAVQVRELVSMELYWQTRSLRGSEHARSLLGREGDALAEGIDRVGQTLLRDFGNHCADLRDVAVFVGGLRRQRVGAEKRRYHIDPALTRKPARGAQHARLGLEIEAVAGFDLDGGGALRDQRI